MVKVVSSGGIIELFRRVATAAGRTQTGFYAIEGIRLHERAVRAGVQIEHLLVGAGLLSEPTSREEVLLQTLAAGTKLTAVPDALMHELTNGRSLGSLLGLIKVPPSPALSTLITPEAQPLFLVALNIIDPGNVGALIRTAHAFGCTAMIATGASDPFHPKAVRTSMGSLFKFPAVRYEEVSSLMHDLENLEIMKVGTAVADGIPLHKTNLQGQPVAIFMGNEYWGLPAQISEVLDVQLSIPMSPGIDSFSVNAAAAIILYELRRG